MTYVKYLDHKMGSSPKKKKNLTLSLFIHLHVVPNLYDLLYSAEHKIQYFKKKGGKPFLFTQ